MSSSPPQGQHLPTGIVVGTLTLVDTEDAPEQGEGASRSSGANTDEEAGASGSPCGGPCGSAGPPGPLARDAANTGPSRAAEVHDAALPGPSGEGATKPGPSGEGATTEGGRALRTRKPRGQQDTTDTTGPTRAEAEGGRALRPRGPRGRATQSSRDDPVPGPSRAEVVPGPSGQQAQQGRVLRPHKPVPPPPPSETETDTEDEGARPPPPPASPMPSPTSLQQEKRDKALLYAEVRPPMTKKQRQRKYWQQNMKRALDREKAGIPPRPFTGRALATEVSPPSSPEPRRRHRRLNFHLDYAAGRRGGRGRSRARGPRSHSSSPEPAVHLQLVRVPVTEEDPVLHLQLRSGRRYARREDTPEKVTPTDEPVVHLRVAQARPSRTRRRTRRYPAPEASPPPLEDEPAVRVAQERPSRTRHRTRRYPTPEDSPPPLEGDPLTPQELQVLKELQVQEAPQQPPETPPQNTQQENHELPPTREDGGRGEVQAVEEVPSLILQVQDCSERLGDEPLMLLVEDDSEVEAPQDPGAGHQRPAGAPQYSPIIQEVLDHSQQQPDPPAQLPHDSEVPVVEEPSSSAPSTRGPTPTPSRLTSPMSSPNPMAPTRLLAVNEGGEVMWSVSGGDDERPRRPRRVLRVESSSSAPSSPEKRAPRRRSARLVQARDRSYEKFEGLRARRKARGKGALAFLDLEAKEAKDRSHATTDSEGEEGAATMDPTPSTIRGRRSRSPPSPPPSSEVAL